MSRPVLLAVAHGSRDPAAQAAIGALARRVGLVAPGLDVRAAFVQNASPSLASALAMATSDVRAAGVTVVPLLLSSGYHLSQDVTAAAQAAGLPVSGPLGPDPLLTEALAERLGETGAPPGTPVVLAAAGSSDPRAAADTRRQAELLAARLGVPVLAAFASAARLTVAEAVAILSEGTGQPVAVASYLLAPGLFHDQIQRSSVAWVSLPLSDHPAVAELVAARFRTARPVTAGQAT